jgi:hypothetical protein
MKLFLGLLLFFLIYPVDGLGSLQGDGRPPSPRSVISVCLGDVDDHQFGYWELIAEISSQSVGRQQAGSESAIDEAELVLFK